MKLAAIYNTFDAEELLEGSIECIHDLCDEVIIIYQQKSNYGEVNYDLVITILKLRERFPKIHAFHYKPDLSISAADNERAKRSFGMRLSKQMDCTHFMFIDNDEFYDAEQFKAAKQTIIKNGYDATACRLYTYYKEPKYRLKPMENYWVPFICAIKEGQVIGQGFNVYADPTRGTKPVDNFYAFPVDELVMHHLSYVRKNIRRKLENSSARGNFNNIDEMVRLFEKWQLGDPLINFPGYEVEIVKDFPEIGINLN